MTLNEADFRTLLDTTHNIVIAFFGANWCGPCKVFSLVFEKVSARYGETSGVTMVKLDVDECTQLCDDLNVSLVPTVILFKDSQVAARQNGGFPNEKGLEQFIVTFK